VQGAAYHAAVLIFDGVYQTIVEELRSENHDKNGTHVSSHGMGIPSSFRHISRGSAAP
jgi:hypothetical protein